MTFPLSPHATRLIPLEAARGIASAIVFVHHFLWAFSPYTMGVLPSVRNADSILGRFYGVLVNGSAAVTFFFTLSGFVLGYQFFQTRDPKIILASLLKRWPRLAFPVVIVTLSSALLFKASLYFFSQAASLNGSPWLASFAYAGLTSEFQPSFGGALFQGLTTFFTGEMFYNTNLWTMQPEFMGSLIVFVLAPFLVFVVDYHRSGDRLRDALFFLFASLALGAHQHLFPFVVGVFLCYHLSYTPKKLQMLPALLLVVVALYLMGYFIPEGDYRLLAELTSPLDGLLDLERKRIVVNTLGAVLLIVALMSNPRLHRALNTKIAAYLGKISFPFYLVHTLVICSFSSYLYLFLAENARSYTLLLILLFIATLSVSLLAALALLWIDTRWCTFLNARVRAVIAKGNSTA